MDNERLCAQRLLCQGSPSGDFWHEVQEGWPVPSACALCHPDSGLMEAYRVNDDGVAIYGGPYDGANLMRDDD